MAIQVENSFVVPVGVDQAWTILLDVPRIAPCIPGAEVTEVVDAQTYRGLARVRIGPVQLVFKGEAKLHDVDPPGRTSRLTAKGADAKGRGSVHSELRFALIAEGERTRVDVTTEIALAGSVAQYGRGIGMIRELCNQLTQQFARNLAAQIEGRSDAGSAQALSAIDLVADALRALGQRGEPATNSIKDGTGAKR